MQLFLLLVRGLFGSDTVLFNRVSKVVEYVALIYGVIHDVLDI